MSSSSIEVQETPTVAPRQTMRGHTEWIRGVVHLPGSRRTITCSDDSTLRLWDLESGAQIGDDWRDEGDKAGVITITLSPNGKTVASGSSDGEVRLWDVEAGKVATKWTGHIKRVESLCWRADGEQVVSGSNDGMAKLWNVKTGETVLEIKTGHEYVWALMFSPDETKIATGGLFDGVQIWDTKKGKAELLSTLEHERGVFSLAWTSNGKKLITGSYGPIRIFDTATWEQIGILEGHTSFLNSITLSWNDCILASTSWDNTARLWNLGTNISVGPPLQHKNDVDCAAFCADGMVLVTGGEDTNVYVWDIHAIFKEAGLEDILSVPDVAAGKSLMDADATQGEDDQLPDFFTDAQDGVYSSATRGIHHRSTARRHRATPSFRSPTVILGRLSSLFRRSQTNTNEAIELQQHSRRIPIHTRSPRTVKVAAARDKKTLFVARRRKAKQTQQQQGQSQGQTQQQQQQGQSQSQAPASSSHSQPAATSMSTTPAPATSIATPCAATVQSRSISWWRLVVLFLCCALPPHSNGH